MTNKIRMTIHLNGAEVEALKKLSAKTGASISEIVRRCIAACLKPKKT